MDVEGYLRRRTDELVSDVRREARLAVAARAWFEGAVTISHSAMAGTSVRAERGAETPIGDRSDPPELEGVMSFGRGVEVPGELRLLLLHLTRWSTGADLAWALLGPSSLLRETRVRSRGVRRQPSPLLWELDVGDDVGTRYRVDGASAGGGAQRQRVEVRLAPRVPDEATSLTIVLRDPDTRDEVAQVAVPLDTT